MRRTSICLAQRVVVIVVCFLLSQSILHGQAVNNKTPQPVVKLRLSFELNKARQVKFSPVSKLLGVQQEDGSVQIIDITDGHEQVVLPFTDKGPYNMQRAGTRVAVRGTSPVLLVARHRACLFLYAVHVFAR